MNATILTVDDDADIRDVLRLLLEAEGYRVLEAANGSEALSVLSDTVSLVILDVMMPGDDGYTVCAAIRESSNVPVLFLTARGQEYDMIHGLKCGGDDYLAKPFSASELSARVDALLRRFKVYQGEKTRRGGAFQRQGIRVNFLSRVVIRDGVRVPLTDLEYKLLHYLAHNAGKTIDAQTLYEAVWEESYFLSSASTIMVHIRNLRKKLEVNPAEPVLIKTVWGKGYRID